MPDCKMTYPSYTAAIRTLGKSGDAFVALIHSLEAQTVPPSAIHVYIAEGYERPKQVSGEKYFTCPRGLATQRALPFKEITTDYILFLDDDLTLASDAVKMLFDGLMEHDGDCIAPNIYPNHHWSFKQKLVQGIFYHTLPLFGGKYAFKIRRSSYYSYCNHPDKVMISQSCAGACMLMKTQAYRNMHYQDEVWLDKVPFASGQDQLFAYKLFRSGYNLLIHYNVEIQHLDAQTGHIRDEVKADYGKRFVRYLIWLRTIKEPDTFFRRILDICAFYGVWCWQLLLSLISFVKGNRSETRNIASALVDARRFSKSNEFSSIPKWKVSR